MNNIEKTLEKTFLKNNDKVILKGGLKLGQKKNIIKLRQMSVKVEMPLFLNIVEKIKKTNETASEIVNKALKEYCKKNP